MVLCGPGLPPRPATKLKTTMKESILAIVLAMMRILFVGCNKGIEPNRGVAQKIIGKWITAETDGKALPRHYGQKYRWQ